MRKVICSVLLFIVILSTLLTMSGCGLSANDNNTDENSCVSLLLGCHKNYPQISLMDRDIYDCIYDAAYNYGCINVVIVDGRPYIAASYDIKKPDKNIDNAKRKQLSKQNLSQIVSECQTFSAKTSEVDTLMGIIRSAEQLQASKRKEKKLIICDSGLSTTGLLDFKKENVIDAEVTSIISRLNELHALPDLNGVTVLWKGLGEVSDDQDELTTNYKYKLKLLWEAILIESGAINVDFEPLAMIGTKEETLPSVSTVPVIQDDLGEIVTLSQPIKLGEESIKFKGDSDEFVDPDEANNALRPLAELIKSNRIEVLLLGTTASAGSKEGCKKLSLARAEAVKRVLVNNGVDASFICTIGFGSEDSPFRVNDIDASGKLIEGSAKENRAVFIMDINSEIAQQFICNG